MVSLWPWKGDDTSPASFEKALSALSKKITVSTTNLDGRRQRARRFQALWTLYSSFVYLLYVMIVALVVGWKNWGSTEYTAVAVLPVVVYLGRLSITTYYNHRISKLQAYVSDLQKQRDTTIAKLKAATKYDSTQQLLEKYGGAPPKPKANAGNDRKASGGTPKQNKPQQRTGVPPPPTANISGRIGPGPSSSTPQRSPTLIAQGPGTLLPTGGLSPPWHQGSPQGSAEFAPNAFAAPQHYAQIGEGPKWYDRLMDVLLGEDESNPKNRLALICKDCRLVNGQAPPGIKDLADVGKWKCAGCGTMNGEVSETRKLLAEIKQTQSEDSRPTTSFGSPQIADRIEEEKIAMIGHEKEDGAESSDVTQYSDEESGKEEAEPTIVMGEEDNGTEEKASSASKPKRGRPKDIGKKKA